MVDSHFIAQDAQSSDYTNATSTSSQSSNQNNKDVNKRCIACGYGGNETVCPECLMLMENKCSNCSFAQSACICNINSS
ncbi:MAG TPA: hypothetical protein VN368_01675, partial [Candidatus Methylomirabilis sp.]|nr:hypothetical protein [Candidatus Methylomirabilis sp.]